MDFTPDYIDALLKFGQDTIARARAARSTAEALQSDGVGLRVAAIEQAARASRAGRDLDELLVVSALNGSAICGPCIELKTRLQRWRVEDALLAVDIPSDISRCDACLKETVVHRLRKNGGT